MDRSTDTEIADSLDADVRSFILTAVTVLTVLDGNLGEPNTDGTNITAKDVAAIEGLPGSDSIVQTLKVDWREVINVDGSYLRKISTY